MNRINTVGSTEVAVNNSVWGTWNNAECIIYKMKIKPLVTLKK